MAEDDTDSTDEADTERPVACTINPARKAERVEQVTEDLAPAYVRTEDCERGLVVVFDGTDGTLAAVASFVADELRCCSFADYSIEVSPPFDETRLRITGPEGTTAMFRDGLLPRLESG